MKHLKQKLMAAVAMLLVSSVMLTSASFAWFSISTAPEVKEIKTTVTANENLEIALGTTLTKAPNATTYQDGRATANDYTQRMKDQTWGANVLSLSDLSGLGPVINTTVGGEAGLYTVTYGTDGRPAGYAPVKEGTIGKTNNLDNGYYQLKDDNGNVIGQTVVLWLRTNVDNAPVTVTVTGITATKTAADGSTSTNPTLAGKVRVAFEKCSITGTALTRGTITEAVKVTGESETSEGGSVDLGTLTADVATPVLMHIYLDGELVDNADVEYPETVTIGLVKFSSTAVGENASTNYTDTYTPTPTPTPNP